MSRFTVHFVDEFSVNKYKKDHVHVGGETKREYDCT